MSRYTTEKKKEIVKFHLQDGRTIQSLAAEYGVSRATISIWVKDYREECQNNEEARSEYELIARPGMRLVHSHETDLRKEEIQE